MTPMVKLDQLMEGSTGSMNPIRYPDEVFDLYSIPAFDAGAPQRVQGREIGSPKQIVQPGDVLLSRIVPHIRRSCVVGPPQGVRQVASGEWIVFRGAGFDSAYLRHLLISDTFHKQFMNTVAGVGGSLMRARPAYVKEISVPLPPLDQQRRIAAILDEAETLRARRHDAAFLLGELDAAVFLDMFGVGLRGSTWPMATLSEVSTINGEYGANVAAADYDERLPRYVRITDIHEDGTLSDEARSPGGTPRQWEKYRLEPGDLLFARSGATVGKTYLHRESFGNCVFAGYLIRFRPNPLLVEPDYLFHFTHTAPYRAWVRARQRVVAQPNINAQQYGTELQIPLPPLELQRTFVARVSDNRRLRNKMVTARHLDDVLLGALRASIFS